MAYQKLHHLCFGPSERESSSIAERPQSLAILTLTDGMGGLISSVGHYLRPGGFNYGFRLFKLHRGLQFFDRRWYKRCDCSTLLHNPGSQNDALIKTLSGKLI